MDRSCGKCHTNCRDSEVIMCGGFCSKKFHIKCAGFSRHEVDALFKFKNLKFICDGCISFIESTNANYKSLLNLVKENNEHLVEKINENNKLVEEQVEKAKMEIVKEVQKNQSYASKLKTNNNTIPVILKPKSKQDSLVTEKQVKEKIKLSALNLQVKGISNVMMVVLP